MIYFLILIFELGLLFVLARKLVNCLAQIIYRFTRNHKIVVHTLAFVFLPGTILHELAHLLFAGVMLVPVGEMSIIPEIEGKGVKLGSVQIGKTDPFRRMIVGVAPVLLGMILIFTIFLLVKLGTSPLWQVILGLFMLFQIGNTMFSSKKDLEGSILFIVLIISLVLFVLVPLYFLKPDLLQSAWIYLTEINWDFAINFFKLAATFLIVPVILDLLVILLAAPFTRRHL